ncbi:MAG TPA: hypothetical protein VF889_08620 [Bacteroidota bacterium]
MPEALLTPAQRAYYVDGFLAALRRYRRATITGWLITAVGVLSLPLGWSGGLPHGLLDLVASCAAVIGGIVLVEQSVGMLESYVQVPFHASLPPDAPLPEPAAKIRAIMEDVDRGGWQDAFAAIAEVQRLAVEYGLMPQATSM